MSQSRALSNRQILRAALVVLVGFLASGLLGLVRTAVLTAFFGTSAAMDAFYAAQRIPEMIFVLVAGGALGSSFIPIYAQRREEDESEAWRLASAVMTLASLAAAFLGILVAIFAHQIVNLMLPSSSPEIHELTVNMMRLMMVTPFIFSISGLVMGILQSHGLFLLPSVAISMNNIGIMLGAFFIAPLLASAPYNAVDVLGKFTDTTLLPVDQIGNYSVYGLAFGAILSAVLHLVVQLPALFQIRAKLRFLPSPQIHGVMQVLRLMLPRVLGLAVVQINFLVNVVLTDQMVTGSYVALTTAFTLMFTALGIIGQSVGSAVFPTLSALYAANDMEGFKERLASAMRSVLFLAFPATVGFMLMGAPLISVFERGEWTAESTQATAWALSFYATGIVGFVLLEVLSRAFYALADTWTPVLVGVGAMISNIVLSLIFIQFIGNPESLVNGSFAGLALANASTTLIESLILWVLIRRRIGDIHDRALFTASAKAIVASLLMGIVLILLSQYFPLQGLALGVFGALIGAVVFFGVAFAFGLEEARAIPMILIRRMRR